MAFGALLTALTRRNTHTHTHTHTAGGADGGEVYVCIVSNSCLHFSELLPLLKQQQQQQSRAVFLRRVEGTRSGQRGTGLDTREEGPKFKVQTAMGTR